MCSKGGLGFICLLVTLPGVFVQPQRPQLDVNLRGHSFGLENFLFQTYDDVRIKDPIQHDVKVKRVRPPGTNRTPLTERGYATGLGNPNPPVFELSRLKPNPINPKYQNQRPFESLPDVARLKPNAGLVRKEQTTEVPKIAQQPEIVTDEISTERTRKRIMMRRRRKRPSNNNNIQKDENGDVTGNAIPKPVRIPISPKETIKTQSPIRDLDERLRPVGVKSIKSTTSQPEVIYAETAPVRQEAIPELFQKSTSPREPSTTSTSTTTTTTTTSAPTSTINLKTFLKQQTETLSLSELLQNQNLSLADLIRGNKDASAILKARQSISASTTPPASSIGFKRKTFNRSSTTTAIPDDEPPPKTLEILEVTTSRPNYNRFHPKIPRIQPGNQKPTPTVTTITTTTTTTTTTTERPFKDDEENIAQDDVPVTTRRPTPHNLGPVTFDSHIRLNELRLKLKNFQRKGNPSSVGPPEIKITATTPNDETTTEQPLYKKNRINYKSSNNPEVSLILPSKLKPEPKPQPPEKRPDRITDWTNRLPSVKRFGSDRIQQSDNVITKTFRLPVFREENEEVKATTEQEQETTTKTTPKPIEEEKTVWEDTRKPEPKDELIELLKSGQNADKLQRILMSRNMTLQELLDNRDKPPLQVNISELFTGQQLNREVTSTQVTLIFDSLPDFELEDHNSFKSESVDYDDEPYAEESAPSTVRIELNAVNREPKQYEITETEENSNLNLQPDDLTADTSNSDNSALWSLSEKSINYGNAYGNQATTTEQDSQKPKILKTTQLTERDIILLETLRKSQETNRKFKLDTTDFVRDEPEPEMEDIEKSYIPPAVKSAIIASGVVMGIALFVFIAIFATCGWKQRQIRLKGSSSIFGDSLTKPTDKTKRSNTLSPVSFKETNSYKKTIDFDDETSESGSSNTSSYLWSTLKNTFTSRTSTLKSRLEKEEKLREDKMTLRGNESRRKMEGNRYDDRLHDSFETEDERYPVKKIDRDRNVISTSFNFKRTASNNSVNHFNECIHGY